MSHFTGYLYAVGTNMPGYSPDPENVYVTHVDFHSDAASVAALQANSGVQALANMLVDTMVRDLESSAESIADDDSGDWAMAELLQSETAGDGKTDIVFGVARAVAAGTDYGYLLSLGNGCEFVYWVQRVQDSAQDPVYCTDYDDSAQFCQRCADRAAGIAATRVG